MKSVHLLRRDFYCEAERTPLTFYSELSILHLSASMWLSDISEVTRGFLPGDHVFAKRWGLWPVFQLPSQCPCPSHQPPPLGLHLKSALPGDGATDSPSGTALLPPEP